MNKKKAYNISLAGFVITFLGAILFSTKAIIVKLAFARVHIDALTLLTLRMIFSLPFYLGVAWFTSRQKKNILLKPRQWVYIFVLGLFGYYVSSLFDFLGLQYISAGLERLILFLYPTFTVLIGAVFFKQPIRRNQWLALCLTYLGILIAYGGELSLDSGYPHFLWGSFLVFVCSITYAVYIAGSGKVIPEVGSTKFTAYAMLSATSGIFIHFLFRGHFSALSAGSGLWWYGLMLAIVATVIPSFLISEGMRRIGSNNVAIISGIGPVATIVQANLFLGEHIFPAQIFGTVLVISGVLLIGWRAGKGAE
jgi:drug/metabolite transporter (DMT)-like permease